MHPKILDTTEEMKASLNNTQTHLYIHVCVCVCVCVYVYVCVCVCNANPLHFICFEFRSMRIDDVSEVYFDSRRSYYLGEVLKESEARMTVCFAV